MGETKETPADLASLCHCVPFPWPLTPPLLPSFSQVTAGGKVTVVDSLNGDTVVDLPLELVLGKMPQKVFNMTTIPVALDALSLPAGLTCAAALDRVLRLLAVGSKRFLTNKVGLKSRTGGSQLCESTAQTLSPNALLPNLTNRLFCVCVPPPQVDRSVTGLVAQQQCVGPLQLPLANCAVIAQSHFSTTGTAVACGEQPIKGLIDSKVTPPL